MKRTAIMISCLITATASGMAQSAAEIFKGNDFLSSVFVSPLGIENIPDYADAVSLGNEIRASGNEYQSMSLGPFGELFRIDPKGMTIGETKVSVMAVCVNQDSVMLTYLSDPSDTYASMYETLGKALNPYAGNIMKSTLGNTEYSIYMLTEKYGIAVGTDSDRKVSIACLLDIRNLQGFLSLDSLIR